MEVLYEGLDLIYFKVYHLGTHFDIIQPAHQSLILIGKQILLRRVICHNVYYFVENLLSTLGSMTDHESTTLMLFSFVAQLTK